MASGPTTSWQINGETMETLTKYIFLGSITADGDCSHETERHLLLGGKAETNNPVFHSKYPEFFGKGWPR